MNDTDPPAPRPSYIVPSQANAEQHLLHDGYDVNTVADQAAVGQQPRDYYANVVHGGNVHFGDRYYVARETDSEQQRIDRLLESLSFPELNLRANQISDSYPETFEWLLAEWNQISDSDSETSNWPFGEGPQDPAEPHWQYQERAEAASADFRSWLKSNDPIHWIYGKPGSGKSTLIKFLATHETTRQLLMPAQSHQASNVAILTHYFWLSGSEFQRSLKGCLASLLYQLCRAHSQLLLYLVRQNAKVRNVLDNKRSLFDWSTKDLTYLFLETMKMMTSLAIPRCIFVDGIDEFDKDGNIDEFLMIIEQLRDQGVKMCLSSRPEPHIQDFLSCYPKLRLQDVTNRDVATLALGQLTEALSRIRVIGMDEWSLHELAQRVVDKAEGVFLWACLAVKSLVNGLRNGDSMTVLEQRLQQLPSGIKNLYHQMWSRVPCEDQLLYRDDASVFLGMAEHLPMSLLRFTVAMDDKLQERILEHEELTGEFLGAIMNACVLMERRLYSRTAGLLTCIRKCDPGKPQPSWGRLPPAFISVTGQAGRTNAASSSSASLTQTARCTCKRHSRTLCTFGPHFLDWIWDDCEETPTAAYGPLEYMHGSAIVLLHRSAAEFIFAEDGEIARVDPMSREEARRRACASIPAVRMLGCGCQEIHELNKLLDSDASDTKTFQLFRPWVKLLTQPRSFQARYSCAHGFYHPVYMCPHLEYSANLRQCRFDCPDFLGLLAFSGGYQFVIDTLQETPGRVSSYYRGYLVICAARGLSPQSTGQRSKANARLKLINWLIMNGANLLTPHVIDVGLHCFTLMARSPIMECWLSMFRLAQRLGTSLWTLLDTRELDALVTALKQTESMPEIPMNFIVGGSQSDAEVDFSVSTGFDGYIVIEAEVNHFGSYCAAKLASLQEWACTTSDQPDLDPPPKLSQIAKITYLSARTSDTRGVDSRYLSVAQTISVLDFVEEGPTHNTVEALDRVLHGVDCRLHHARKSTNLELVSVLAEHGRRLGMTDYHGQRYSCIVPPDLYHELDEQTWYEQGELREGMIWREG